MSEYYQFEDESFRKAAVLSKNERKNNSELTDSQKEFFSKLVFAVVQPNKDTLKAEVEKELGIDKNQDLLIPYMGYRLFDSLRVGKTLPYISNEGGDAIFMAFGMK